MISKLEARMCVCGDHVLVTNGHIMAGVQIHNAGKTHQRWREKMQLPSEAIPTGRMMPPPPEVQDE